MYFEQREEDGPGNSRGYVKDGTYGLESDLGRDGQVAVESRLRANGLADPFRVHRPIVLAVQDRVIPASRTATTPSWTVLMQHARTGLSPAREEEVLALLRSRDFEGLSLGAGDGILLPRVVVRTMGS